MIEINEHQITIYHDIVFSYCEGLIPLRSFNEKKYGQNNLIWIDANKQTALEAIKNFAINADREESSALCIPGTVKERGQAKSSEICEMQVLLVDIDCGDIEAKLLYASNWLGIPSMIVESGGIIGNQKKLHAYWKLMEPATGTDLDRLIEIRRVLALKIGGDEHFGSAHQPIRIAGTIYHKAEEPRLTNIRSNNDMEYNLWDLEDIIFEMSAAPFVTVNHERAGLRTSGYNKLTVQELFRKEIRSGGIDEVSKFSALSTIIGFWLNRFHKGDVTVEEALEEIHSYNIARISPPWEKARLDDEINRLWKKHVEKYGEPVLIDNQEDISSHNIGRMFSNKKQAPTPYLLNGLLPERSLMVVAGPPKIGKSTFILNLLTHMSLGKPYFNTFIPTKPLNIYYLQAELKEFVLLDKLENIEILNEETAKELEVSCRFMASEAASISLDDKGIQQIIKLIKKDNNPIPDVICIDPVRNFFFSGGNGDDNSVAGMKDFCRRVMLIRDQINPNASIIMVHHTRKIDTKMMEEDPFNMIAGSSFLRSFYDTGIMFYRPDPKVSNNALMQFEVRNRRTKEPWAHDIKIILDRDKNTFITEQIEVDPEQRKDLKKLHKELRVQQQLVELIENEAREGRIYTIQKFAETFENQYGLLGAKTVIRKLNTLAQKQIVKFFNNPEEYGLVFERAYKTRSMFMCMSEEMELKTEGGNVYVRPNYYKSAVDGSFCEL
jgi:uncharacterized protein (UPF0335 family)